MKKTKRDSKRGSKNGGQPPKKRPPAPPDLYEPPLNFYRCSNCGLHIEPRYVHRMESNGPANEDVVITHACQCIPPDTHIYALYDFVPGPLRYLMNFETERIHRTGDDGWWWETTLKQWPVSHYHPDLQEMRGELEHCNSVEDFDRLRGLS